MDLVKPEVGLVILFLLAVYMVPSGAAWLDSWGKLNTGEVSLMNPILVAHPSSNLRLNDLEVDDAKNMSISGQEVLHFDSNQLPGERLDKSEIIMNIEAKTDRVEGQTLDTRLRYTNSTGTFIACNQEILIESSSYKKYISSCEANITSEEPVKYHYELIGAPKTDYTVAVNGSTYIEADVRN